MIREFSDLDKLTQSLMEAPVAPAAQPKVAPVPVAGESAIPENIEIHYEGEKNAKG